MVYKFWYKKLSGMDRRELWDGWFLFGFIPVYIRLKSLNA